MPIYEYACAKCEHEFEREQSISDKPVKTCPKCRARRVKRLISRTSFVLKGGGWYSDLYSSAKTDKKSEAKASAKSDSDSKSSSDTKSSGSDKSKPSAKPAGKTSKKSAA